MAEPPTAAEGLGSVGDCQESQSQGEAGRGAPLRATGDASSSSSQPANGHSDVESLSTRIGFPLHAADHHRTILKAIPDVIVRVSRSGRCVVHSWYGNEESPSDDEQCAQLNEVLPHEVANLAAQAVTAALDSDTLQRFDCQLPVGGDLRSFEVRVVPFVADEALAIVRDVTERKFTEDLLRLSEQRLRQVIDAMNVYVGLLSPDGTLIEANRLPLEIAGLRRSEVLGRKLWDAFWFVDLAESQSLLRQAVRSAAAGEEVRFDAEARIAADERVNIDLSIRPLINSRQEVELLVATGVDVTQRLQAHDEVRRLHADLAHVLRMATIDEMAAGIAHELNQPLTAIQNYSHTLATLHENPTSAVGMSVPKIVAAIEEQVQRASDIIRGLRDLARKSTSQQMPNDLNDLVARVLAVVEADSKPLDIEITSFYDTSLPPVCVDGVQIQQVVLNLVRNAIESIGPGNGLRSITLTTGRLSDEYAIVTVVDTGPGLERVTLDAAFQAFFTTKPSGLGMGLPLSRSIVEAHGGRIWAQSVPGRETVFHFTLPFAAAEQLYSCLVN